ncbi:MAG TPA: TonB-dependent receptor [Candidatus Angelobacter sp.]|nr:TonB-dependent receptor [Candidatus Angelobacter sp.]
MIQIYFYSDRARRVCAWAVKGICLLLLGVLGRAQDQHPDLTQLTLEQLSKLEVTSVSRKKQQINDVAAAVYVITQQDIHSSGARNIPDLLRMVPGVDVAQITAHTWAISIRGFGDIFTDKVLVLIDGRSVYTPTTSGVYWDQQDVPLEDIDRIEVIRGPGGTVWGANAVNGVINIITKSAHDTQGGLITAGAGLNETADALLQYGGKVRKAGDYRVLGSYSNSGSQTAADGTPAADGWHNLHLGFRSDWDLSKRDTLTVQGDLLSVSEGLTVSTVLSNASFQQATFNTRVTVGAGNLLERWNRTLSDHSDISLQAYYDGYNRHDPDVPESRHTFDIDFHHHLAAGARNDIVWGLGYRVTSDDLRPGFSNLYVPQQRTDSLFSVFLQDEIRIINSLRLTLGSKLEHNAYTGLEYEPGVQLTWTPAKKHALWLSVARAIRQPSRSDVNLQVDVATFPLDNGGTGVLRITGDPDQDRRAEVLLSYQLGYRAQISKRFSFDATGFLNRYRHLQTQEPGQPFAVNPAPDMVFPLFFDDQAHARTYGGEIFATWNVTSRWRISPSYSFIHMVVNPDASSQDTTVAATVDDTPRHKFAIRSLLRLPHHLDWDVALYHVNSFLNVDTPSYNRVDTRLAWCLGETTEFSVVGQNLLSPRHAEFPDAFYVNHTLVKRSAYAKVTWRF